MTFKNKFDLVNIRQIRDAVIQRRIQIINAQSSKDRYTSILAKWLYRLPVKLFLTRRQIPKSTGFFLQNWFYTKGTDKIICVSAAVADAMAKLGIPRNHLLVIYNGTPKEKYHSFDPGAAQTLRAKYNIPPQMKVIGCVSRRKKQEVLLKAIGKLKTPVAAVFVGIKEYDDYKAVAEEHCAEHNKLIYTGVIPPDQALNHYSIFDIHVMPSITEGLSQSLLEAMALGVPVIGTNSAGNKDLITHGDNGFLFEDENIVQLSEQIEILLQDHTIRRKFIENAKRTALIDFSMDNTVKNYEQFFESYMLQ